MSKVTTFKFESKTFEKAKKAVASEYNKITVKNYRRTMAHKDSGAGSVKKIVKVK